MLHNYRTTNNFNEIVKIFKRSQGEVKEDDSFLWQNINGSRVIFPIKNFVVNEKFMTIQAEIKQSFTDSLEAGENIYAKVFYRDTVFKTKVINRIDNNVTFSLPLEVKTIEMRENYRFKFKPSEKKHATISYDVDLVMSAKRATAFQVIDISETGISIVVSEKDISLFEAGNTYNLNRLQDMDLALPYQLEFIYHQKFRFKSKGRIQTAYRVGFRSQSPISKLHLEYFTIA